MVFNAVEQLEMEPAPPLKAILGNVRLRVAPMIEDRYFAPDVSIAKELILGNLIAS